MNYNGKATIDDSIGLSISVPSAKNWFALIFGTLWLGGWYFGLTNALKMPVFEGEGSPSVPLFMVVWISLWSAGGIFIIFMLLWGYFGREVLELQGQQLHFEKSIFGIGLKKKLEVSFISNIRTDFSVTASGIFNQRNRWSAWGLGPGRIKFDYGMKTYSFGLGIDEAEALHIADIMRRRLGK